MGQVVNEDARHSSTLRLPWVVEPEQRDAIFADDPVVCVLAGAGTGKTRVLTSRVARRLQDGSAQANHVLVCTFSRKAAGELRSRLWALGIEGIDAGTFHHAAIGIITRHRAEQDERPPQIVADRRPILDSVLARDRTARAPRDVVRLDAEISWAKARLVAPADYEHECRLQGRRPSPSAARVADVYARYEETRRRRDVLDLDDLLRYAGDLLEEDPTFAHATRWWHRQVFVDEMQDANEAQFRLLQLVVGERPDLFVVGDPDQAVYGWNGADPTLLRRVVETYAGTRVVTLRTNHRCSPEIVHIASVALGLNQSPASARSSSTMPRVVTLASDDEEARWVAGAVWLAHRPGTRWSSIAVLARTNAQLARVSAALRAQRVPCQMAGGDLGPGSDAIEGPDHGARDEVEARAGVEMEEPEATGGTEGGEDASSNLDAVTLSTFHRAKGLQWRAVFVVGLCDGIVPWVSARSAAAKEEERRLLYVALTRAEDELTCTWATAADDTAAGSKRGARRISPWLPAVEKAIETICSTRSRTGAEDVSRHLDEIRALVAQNQAEPHSSR